MSQDTTKGDESKPPAMGERYARGGYGYQDKVATERILQILREELRLGKNDFESVRLADTQAGRVDDFVLIWKDKVEGNSIKWSREAVPFNWGDLIGSHGLLKELADGYRRLQESWPNKAINVSLQSNRPPSTERHHAQIISEFSVATFFRDHWLSGPTSHDSVELMAAWVTITEHIGLSTDDTKEFVNSCNLVFGHAEPPGIIPDSKDGQHYNKQFDDLHKAIATWCTNNPSADFIDRYTLLSALGIRSDGSGLIQNFPFPRIPYSKNNKAAERLTELINGTDGGYIAVVGQAGIGKSTLVQDVLSDDKHPFFIPYYAFLPETEGIRDRGEALTFYQDIIARLDKFFSHRYSIGITDIAQGREALRKHMSKAHEQYITKGQKTVLLIDGLDHISREKGLQHSLLHEIPDPEEVPTGFLIILSTQPQALIPGTISRLVGTALTPTSDRRMEVSGLIRSEVYAIFEKIDRPTTGSERDALYSASQGNPLIIFYLINFLQRVPGTSIAEAIERAGSNADDMENYYRSALAIPLQDAETRRLLGLLCRAAPTIPTEWLQEWPERDQIENIYERILTPFVEFEDGNLKIIHNSLIAFLKAETRSRLPGTDQVAEEIRFHSTLADLCGERPCVDPLGRARVLHLLRSDRNSEVLTILSSQWLRYGIDEYVPYALIHPLILSGFKAAWSINEIGEVLRLILLDHELIQKSYRLDPGDLAEALLKLDHPELAISQIMAAGRLLVDDDVVLNFIYSLKLYAGSRNRLDLERTAYSLYMQAKPISLFYMNESIETWPRHENIDLLIAWSRVAPFFEDSTTIISQIKGLNFQAKESAMQSDEKSLKAYLIYEALFTVMDLDPDCNDTLLFLDEISNLGKITKYFAALLTLARKNSKHFSLDVLSDSFNKAERNNDIDLAYAELLYEQGYAEESKEIVVQLSHIKFDGVRNERSYGYTDISYTVTLCCLQELLGISEEFIPDVKDDYKEAYARIETTARKIGALLAIAKQNKGIPNLTANIRSLLLFHNEAVEFPEFDWRANYVVGQAKMKIYKEIVGLAVVVGEKGLMTLRTVFWELVNGLAGPQFSPKHRRFFAEELFRYGELSRDEAVALGLSSTQDTEDEDPMQRQEACLDIANFLNAVGKDSGVTEWIKKSSEVSAGTGSHKDYHMSSIARWLGPSVGESMDSGKLIVLEKFARAIQVAGGDGASEAATKELQLMFRLEPIRASRLAIELIDRNVLNVSQVFEALILEGAKNDVSSNLLFALYGELVSLISPGDTLSAAVTTLKNCSFEEKVSTAKAIMNHVRTNSLPSNRLSIGRAIQDELLRNGFEEAILHSEPKPERDETSFNDPYYWHRTGKFETIEEVAERLSNSDDSGEWNPNPDENANFDWWTAIKRVKVRDESHLDTILSTIPLPDYKDVEILVWKSEQVLKLSNRNTAALLAKQAIDLASDGTWHHRLDGARKKIAYGALKLIDREESIAQARIQFGRDLSAGKMNSSYLLYDIVKILEFLELDWPGEEVLVAIEDYIDQMLNASQDAEQFQSLIQASKAGSAEDSICILLIHLLAFPVVDVGIAARRALAKYAATDGNNFFSLIKNNSNWDSVQLEHILVSLHMASIMGDISQNDIQG